MFNKVLMLLQVIIKKYKMKYNSPVQLIRAIIKLDVGIKNKKKNIAKKDRFAVWYLKLLRSILFPKNRVISRKLSRALWRQGAKRKESLQLRLWNLNSTSNSPVAPRRLSCQIFPNQREAETSANVNKH